jgi:deazaflavin-dependent oxidoreductase (nitroreductase family)
MTDPNAWNKGIIEEFRANSGKVGGRFNGAPMVLLTTTGAKSGNCLTTPLVCLPDGDRLLVFASKGGAPKHPSWYHNLVANPTVTVEYGTETFEAQAEPITGGEHDRLYAKQAAVFPGFGEYQRNTTRVIPVVALNHKG